MRFPFPVLLIALSLLLRPAIAQQKPDQPITTITCFSGEEAIQDLYLENGSELTPLTLLPYTPGSPIDVSALKRTLKFVKIIEKPVAKLAPSLGATPEEPPGALLTKDLKTRTVAKVTLPETGLDFLLAFTPVKPPRENEEYSVEILPSDHEQFPVGAVRLMNRSPFPIVFQLGKFRETLDANKTVILRPELDKKNRTYMQLAARREQNGKWELFHEGVVSVSPRQRMTYIFAYTLSYLDLIGSDVYRGPGMENTPEMVAIPWAERPRVR